MGEGLVGAMVAALRRANLEWAEASRAARRKPTHREGGGNPAWGYLAHPSLMPTVFSPSAAEGTDGNGESVAERKV